LHFSQNLPEWVPFIAENTKSAIHVWLELQIPAISAYLLAIAGKTNFELRTYRSIFTIKQESHEKVFYLPGSMACLSFWI
jgi:hypothetical protein